MNRARWIRSEKQREYQYRGGYTSYLESKRVESDGESSIENIREHLQLIMVESGSWGGKKPKCLWGKMW